MKQGDHFYLIEATGQWSLNLPLIWRENSGNLLTGHLIDRGLLKMARPYSSVTKPPVFEHKLIQTFLKQNRKFTCTAVGYRLGFPKKSVFCCEFSVQPWEHADTITIFAFPQFVRSLDGIIVVHTCITGVYLNDRLKH